MMYGKVGSGGVDRASSSHVIDLWFILHSISKIPLLYPDAKKLPGIRHYPNSLNRGQGRVDNKRR